MGSTVRPSTSYSSPLRRSLASELGRTWAQKTTGRDWEGLHVSFCWKTWDIQSLMCQSLLTFWRQPRSEKIKRSIYFYIFYLFSVHFFKFQWICYEEIHYTIWICQYWNLKIKYLIDVWSFLPLHIQLILFSHSCPVCVIGLSTAACC